MTIFESIGGTPAVQAAVDDFYVRVLADPELAPYFAEVDLGRLKAHQRAFIAAAIGGPQMYSGRDMATAHARLGVTGEHFDAVVGHLVRTLQDLGVPDGTIAQVGASLAPLRGDIVSAAQ
jgi:hemoglobin